MKSLLPGYSIPTKQAFDKLWSGGLFVFDTNVLLDLYRYPAGTRDEVLAVLKSMESQVWIPHQVAVEFERNRLEVIRNQRKSLERLKVAFSKAQSELQTSLISLDFGRRTSLNIEQLVADAKSICEKLDAAVDKALSDHPDISLNDDVRESIANLWKGKIGDKPSQIELDKICESGKRRFELKQPPGFLDVNKDTTYVCDGLVFEPQYGDLILWQQLIAHAAKQGIKHVAFVTSESSSDWWYEFEGKKLGPLPELTHEIMREAKVEVFWMYSVEGFLSYSKEFRGSKVKDQSIRDVRESTLQDSEMRATVAERLRAESGYLANARRLRTGQPALGIEDDDDPIALEFAAQNAVRNWLANRYPAHSVYRGGRFPDLIVEATGLLGQKHGFELMLAKRLTLDSFLARVRSDLVRGDFLIQQQVIDMFTLVVVVPSGEKLGVVEYARLVGPVETLAGAFEKCTVVIGALVGDVYEPLDSYL